ncbi:MAG: isopeptide-forming domain-containing fimbrial protein [Stomatobaculum sp.]|nr:isopeptide-forming domain-containing fimbrial protein [Stomatobaculum sp.]
MIRLKKMLALAIAVVMVLCTMNLGVFAAPGDLTPDQSITITGLDEGDVVHLYQVLVWEDSVGWRLNGGEQGAYASLLSNANIKKLIDNDANNGNPVELTKADVDAVATAAKNGGTEIDTSDALTGDTYTFTATTPGMFLALVTPGKAGVVYNPIIVSADFSATPNTSEIDASNAVMGETAVAKKKKITVDKHGEVMDEVIDETATEEEKIVAESTHSVGDIVKFTIETQIPAYSDAYTNPTFTVTDTLTNGLKIVVDDEHEFSVSSGSVTYTGDPADGDTSFTLTFTSADIAALLDYQDVVIEYYAIIGSEAVSNVNEMENTVEVEFSNDPHDDTSKGKIKDKTKHYTFTIDGELLGEEGFRVIELLKVGKNADGTDAIEEIEISNGTMAAALDGALFGLYKTPEGAEAEDDNDLYTNDIFNGKVETAMGGLLVIQGLDAGTYYLKELDAPDGFIRDTGVYEIVIDADIVDEETTEVIDGYEVTYSVPVLKGYTITINGTDVTKETTYTASITGSETLEVIEPEESTTEIANTKGVELPATGGMGTTIFYVIGTILVLGAGILLVTRRRMNVN